MKRILLNVSNHSLVSEQINVANNAGITEILDLPEVLSKQWGQMTPETYVTVCLDVVNYIKSLDGQVTVHIAGFQPAVVTLVKLLSSQGIESIYSYSKRISVEENINGEVVKTSKFVFEGFYPFQ